jgi:protein TonB
MFDQIISENAARTRRPLAVALSFAGQVALVTLTVLFPILRTESIVPGRSLRIISAPRTWGRPEDTPQKPAVVRVTGRPGPHVLIEGMLRQPAQVPSRILIETDEPPEGVLQGAAASTNYGMPDGVYGAIPTGMIQHIVAPPKPASPPPVSAPRAPVRIGGDVQAAKIVHQVTPLYPPLAKQARISGVVRLEAIIGRNGMIESLHVTSGHPLLAQAALDAVRQWVYRPTLLNGDPVEVLTQIDVHFKLGE